MDEETTSSGPPAAPRAQAALWTGVGVLVAGIGVLGYALLVAEDVYPTESDGPSEPPEQYRPWLTFVLAVLAVLPAVPAVTTAAGALGTARAAARGSSTAFPRPQRLDSAGVLLVGMGFSFLYWWNTGEAPFPGDRALLVTSAYGFVLAGRVVVHVAGTRMWSAAAVPRPWSRPDTVAFVGGVVAVALTAGTVVTVVGEPARVDATTAAVAQAPPVPTDPSRVLWRWSDAERIIDAVAAGAGVVVATGDGIVALDGPTGQERWHYRLPGSTFYPDLVTVDEGRTVIASFAGRLHAFDAFTGELRWRDREATAQAPPAWAGSIVATHSTVVRGRHQPPHFAGTDVRTGEVRWQYTLPPHCYRTADAYSIGDTVIIRGFCSHLDEITALDGATGELLWRKSPPGEAVVRAGMILSPISDSRIRIDPRSGQESGVETDGIVLASDSGELVTSEGSLYEIVAAEPRWQLPTTAPRKDGHRYTPAATFLGDVAVLVNLWDRVDLELTIVDRADGTVRRTFGGSDMPAADNWDRTSVFPAPGAVVVNCSEELVAIG